ncbi:hypothetical protein KEM60_00831 [Austwickia sp. TVS 96-490-7B]|uniref:HAD hydrolase family protein n=1 Tax=Austwickia sp. TVS 96-490-7B TaxID=2830843 RepID=UPI001C58B614|nr:HAD hydrolase family protein [Austwickia sp. TVS 96-490-7B]MBW3084642.1 hypothetical protein [Austwickia sp. TVS 96-490-7B]
MPTCESRHSSQNRYIFDLDGTLAFDSPSGYGISPEVRSALRSLKASKPGDTFIVASSRASRGIRALLGSDCDLFDFYYSLNGALVLNSQFETVEKIEFEKSVACATAQLLSGKAIPFYVDRGDSFEVFGGGFDWLAHPSRVDSDFAEVCNLNPYGICKISLTIRDGDELQFQDSLSGAFSVNHHHDGVIDLTPGRVGKEVAVVRGQRRGERVTMFGNDNNDIKALSLADYGVVVGDEISSLRTMPRQRVERIPALASSVAGMLRKIAHDE